MIDIATIVYDQIQYTAIEFSDGHIQIMKNNLN